MGAKDWMLIYADGDVRSILETTPALDRPATRALVERLYPSHTLTDIEDGNLVFTNPPDGDVLAGCFPGLTVICTSEVALDYPSRLPARFLAQAAGRTTYLHAMASAVDWFAYGLWKPDGTLARSLSLSPGDGIMENLGDPLPFEEPFWAGERPVGRGIAWASALGRTVAREGKLADIQGFFPEDNDSYWPQGFPLPFHPLELAEAALRNLFGFNYEGYAHDDDLDLGTIVLAGYRVSARPVAPKVGLTVRSPFPSR